MNKPDRREFCVSVVSFMQISKLQLVHSFFVHLVFGQKSCHHQIIQILSKGNLQENRINGMEEVVKYT